MLKHDAKTILISEKLDAHSTCFLCAENIASIYKNKFLIKAVKNMEILFELNSKSICRGLEL